MEPNFVDLDAIIATVRDRRSRNYLYDSVRAFRAGAFRPALTAIWVAVAFDLIAKYRELAGLGDAEATSFIKSWDKAGENANTYRLLKLERELLDHAAEKLQLLEPIGLRQLRRLLEDRHLCAHPAFSSEAGLFEPSADLVRAHMVSAVELVLSQRPIQGRAILTEFDQDITSSGFPSEFTQIADYFEQRYLSRTRPANTRNLGTVLAKAVLLDEPANWVPFKDKIEGSLVCFRERRPNDWQELETDIVRLINELEPRFRLNSVRLLARFPTVIDRLEPGTLTVINQSIINFDLVANADLSFFAAVGVEQFREALYGLIDQLDEIDFARVIQAAPMIEFWPTALDIFSDAGSFRGAENYFRVLIAPFTNTVSSDDLESLFAKMLENAQITWARDIPGLLVKFVTGAAPRSKLSFDARTNFYQGLGGHTDPYRDLWNYFSRDGWKIPEPAED